MTSVALAKSHVRARPARNSWDGFFFLSLKKKAKEEWKEEALGPLGAHPAAFQSRLAFRAGFIF